MENANETWGRQERDLLIELRTEMAAVRVDIKELKDNMGVRINLLERDKADRREVEALQGKVNDDVDVRVEKLEGSRDRYFIVSGLYTLFTAGLVTLLLFHIFYQR